MEPSPPPASDPSVKTVTIDITKLASHEHRLHILSELSGHRVPNEHSPGYFLLTDLFSLHAFLKPRNALKRMRALPIQGKWIKFYSGGRYCTLAAFDTHVLKYIQTEIAKRIYEYLKSQQALGQETEYETSQDEAEGKGKKQHFKLDEMDELDEFGDEELDELDSELDELEPEHEGSKKIDPAPMKSTNKSRSQKTSTKPSPPLSSSPSDKSSPSFPLESNVRPNPSSRSKTSSSRSSSRHTHSAQTQSDKTNSNTTTKEKRPLEDPLVQLRQTQKFRAMQIQEDMLHEERSCVQFLYNTLRQLHQQIVTEYKEETAKQITVITEQLKLAKTRLKDVLEFEI